MSESVSVLRAYSAMRRAADVRKAVVVILVFVVLLFAYLAIRWSDPAACPGLQALDPVCMRVE